VAEFFHPIHGGREKAEKMGVDRVSALHPWGAVKRVETRPFPDVTMGGDSLEKSSFGPPSFRQTPKSAKTLDLDCLRDASENQELAQSQAPGAADRGRHPGG